MKPGGCALCCISLMLAAAVTSGCSSSQSISCLYTESEARSFLPDFLYDTFSYQSDGKTRVELFLQVGYFVLNFGKEATRKSGETDGYSARFTVTVLFRTGEQLVKSDTWTENIHVDSYEETRGRTYSVSRRLFLMDPGSYRLSIEVVDETTGGVMQKGKTVVLPDFEKKTIGLSSITVGTRRIQEGRYVLPTVSGEIVDGSDSLFSQCEVSGREIGERVRVTYRLTSYQYKKRLGTKPEFLGGFAGRNVPQDSLTVTIDTVVTVPNGRLVLQQSFTDVRKAYYRLSVTARPSDERPSSGAFESGAEMPFAEIAVATKAFTVRSIGFPEVVSIEDQIESLAYIATDSEYRGLLEGGTVDEKRARLEEFWTSHVGRNLYYERVAYANRYFTCKTEGWRTFPGYIYIVVGSPDAVECLQRTERWFYTSPVLNVSFRWRREVEGGRECRFTYGTIDPYLLERYFIRWQRK